MADRDLTLPSRGARLRSVARGLGVSDFWQWWRAQLDPLLPQTLRTAVARRRMRPVVVFAGDHATLWQPAVEARMPLMRPVATIPISADPNAHAAEGRAALALGRDKAGGKRVVVSLAPADLLRRRLTLPLALEENLRQALAYDLDRHTPFKPSELYFDATVVDRSAARGTIVVDLATARRTVVDPLLRHVAAWGGEVAAVVPEAPATASRSRLNLLPVDARTTRALLRRWQFWVPFVAIVAAVLAAIAIPIWQKREEAIALGLDADEARARAAISETLRAEVNAKVNDYNFALERKYSFPGALAVVDTVSKVLPDDTWLTQFELKTMAKGKDTQREIMLRGETANAGKLVQLLEESQMFAQAAQRGPTTKIQPGPGEIFDLGAQLRQRPGPPPATVVVASDKGAGNPVAGTAGAPSSALPAAGGATAIGGATPPAAGGATSPAKAPSAPPGSAAPAAGASPLPAGGASAGNSPGATPPATPAPAANLQASPAPASPSPVPARAATAAPAPGASPTASAAAAPATPQPTAPAPSANPTLSSPTAAPPVSMAPSAAAAGVPAAGSASTGGRREARP